MVVDTIASPLATAVDRAYGLCRGDFRPLLRSSKGGLSNDKNSGDWGLLSLERQRLARDQFNGIQHGNLFFRRDAEFLESPGCRQNSRFERPDRKSVV